MLAATVEELNQIKYPIYASPKLDGIRGVIVNGVLKSRSLKPISNRFVSARFSSIQYTGLDGELILGSPTAKDVYRQTNAACSRIEGEPDVKFYVFDLWDRKEDYEDRYSLLDRQGLPHVTVLETQLVENEAELLDYEANQLALGYEGLILRGPAEFYKFGRSTLKSQGMLKLKRFLDSEAEILEVIEEMENTNAAKTNELGRTARSSAKAGLVGKSRAGGFRVVDIQSKVEFNIGTGLNDEDKEWYWKKRKKVIGKIIKYKYFPVGVKDAPRHPVYLGGREEWDL